MVECRYVIKREINGAMHEIILNRDEISAIWVYYDDVLIEERIVNKLIDDYGVKDITALQSLIDDLVYRYNKNRGYGCDDEHSMDFAFGDLSDEINSLLTAE